MSQPQSPVPRPLLQASGAMSDAEVAALAMLLRLEISRCTIPILYQVLYIYIHVIYFGWLGGGSGGQGATN